jgi:hypothetical protein
MPCCILAAISGPFFLLATGLRNCAAQIIGSARVAGDPVQTIRFVTPWTAGIAAAIEVALLALAFGMLPHGGPDLTRVISSRLCPFSHLSRAQTRHESEAATTHSLIGIN